LHFLRRGYFRVHAKVTDEPVERIGVQHAADFRPDFIPAPDGEEIAVGALRVGFQEVSNRAEMLRSFVEVVALGMSAVIACKAVTAALSQGFAKKVLKLREVFIRKLEDACLGAIDERHQYVRSGFEDRSERL